LNALGFLDTGLDVFNHRRQDAFGLGDAGFFSEGFLNRYNEFSFGHKSLWYSFLLAITILNILGRESKICDEIPLNEIRLGNNAAKSGRFWVTMGNSETSFFHHFPSPPFLHLKARRAFIYQGLRAKRGAIKMVRDTGFEPVTPAVSRQCSTTELTAHWGG
jgi:hypothetical protein